MAGSVASKTDFRGLAHRLTAAHGGVPGHDFLEQEVGHIPFPAHRGFIDFHHAAGFALRLHLGRRGRDDLGVVVNIVEPKQKIVRRERCAIGPFHAFAQQQRIGLAVFAEFITLCHARHDLAAVSAPGQRLVLRLDAIAVFAIAGPGERAPPCATVLADLVQRLPHQWLGRDALFDGRQFAGLYQLGEHRCFIEFRWPSRRVGDHRRVLNFPDKSRSRQIRGSRQRARNEFHRRRTRCQRGEQGAAGHVNHWCFLKYVVWRRVSAHPDHRQWSGPRDRGGSDGV